MIKYIIVPGEVQSRHDGQAHYVTAYQLMKLYGVDPKSCKILGSKIEQATYRVQPHQIILTPRFDGDYSLPSAPSAAK